MPLECVAIKNAAHNRDRLAAERRIEPLKLARQRFERGIGNRANHPQRVIRPDPFLKVYVAEKLATDRIVAAHRPPLPPPQGITMRKFRHPFLAACETGSSQCGCGEPRPCAVG